MNVDGTWVTVAVAVACGWFGAWIGGLLVARQVRQRFEHAPIVQTPASADAMQALTRSLDARVEAHQRGVQEAVDRLPQTVQRALQVELDFLVQQQAQRDADRRQREQARDEALHLLIASIKEHAPQPQPQPQPPTRSAVPASAPAPAMRPPAEPPRTVSARPPELLLTPLPQPEPVYDEPEPERVLSDEEIDALPPELPLMERPRKRLLSPPKKPVLRNL